MKALIKEFQILVKKGDKKKAEEALPDIYKAIDKAAKKKILKKGNASRKKSRLTKSLNKIDVSDSSLKIKKTKEETKKTTTKKKATKKT